MALPFIEATLDIQRGFIVAGRSHPRDQEAPNAFLTMATPDYFRTLGMPLLEGRSIQSTDDANAPGVAVISEARHKG